MILEQGRRVLDIEAEAIQALSANLDEAFSKAVLKIASASGRVILTGVGKSGIICRKIAATLASTGTPAFFVHPTEAIHGDLGMIVQGDIVIAISNSGETVELVHMLEFVKRQGAELIAITGKKESTLGRLSDLSVNFSIKEEGCPMGLAPMASTTVTLALGDALAAGVMEQKGFTSKDFAKFHPGGKLGKKLLRVVDAMKKHMGRPIVQADTILSQALIEISDKRLGMTAVTLADDELGLLTDGDVRRLLQEKGHSVLEEPVERVCTRHPKKIQENALASEALHLMETYKITSLIVIDQSGAYTGVVHLHDLWQTQMV